MTKDDVIALARKAGMRKYQHNLASNPVQIRISFDGDEAALLRFAAMLEQCAAAAEREACAKIAEFTDLHEGDCLKNSDPRKTCASAIRARSNK